MRPTDRPKNGEALTSFASSLYRELCVRPGNLFFSPFSAATACTMLQAGAGGRQPPPPRSAVPGLAGFIDCWYHS